MSFKDNFVQIENVSVNLDGKLAIDQISCKINLNKKTGIIGETGSGKSTLLKTISGLIQPNEGNISYKNERILGPNEKLLPGHDKIAYLSQHFELRNNYQVWDILSFANVLTEQEAEEIYKCCKVDHLMNRWTDELSGGEKQRIALAKLLITKPSLLLLDEPFSNLDNQHKKSIYEVLNDVIDRFQLSVILVSHDAMDILSWTEETFVLKSGRVVQSGKTENIFNSPIDEYTAGLLGEFQLLESDPLFSKIINGYQSEKHKHLFIRPHYFRIENDKNSNSLSGIIKEIIPYSFYFLINVELGQHKLSVISINSDLKQGDFVDISYNKKDFHLL